MSELVNQSAIEHMIKIFVIAMFLLLFWLFEAVWQKDKRWIIPIIIFPPLLIPATIHAWETTRGRYLFVGIFIAVAILASAVVKYNFMMQLWILLRDLSIWPYYLLQKLF